MEHHPWLQSCSDPDLEAETGKKIAALKEFEREIPAVLIIHDLETQLVVYMSQRGLDQLGISLQDIRLPISDYHAQFFNKADADYYVPKILDLVARNTTDDLISYFQQVRYRPDQDWLWHLSSTKIFLRDKEGRPRLIITISMAVDTQHPIATKMEKLLEENEFLRKHHHIFSSLTRREKEILKSMALGHSSLEIANCLHISETTANTHRRNIRKKISANSSYDITRFAKAFDLI